MEENYYWSDDLSNDFFVEAAKAGFITTCMYKDNKFILLPEIQFDYAILDFDNIKIPSKVKSLLNKDDYTFTINNRFEEVLERIKDYHEDSWMKPEYINLLNNIKDNEKLYKNFKLISVELAEKETNRIISGEIGYQVGNIYTSLSGFTTKEKKYNNWGKLQLVLLNSFLKNNSFKFWNLGHPQLQYKLDLGAKVYNRTDFLERWNKE